MSSQGAWSIREIAGPAGQLEVRVDEPPASPRAAVVIGHSHPRHGGTMHDNVVHRAAKAFQSIGCAVLRFNFLGVGLSTGTFDDGRGEKDDFRAGLSWFAERHQDLPLWSAGFSFGAWIAVSVGAIDRRVSLMLGIAPPTHYDLTAFRPRRTAKFLVHGEADELVAVQDIWTLYDQLKEPKELVVIAAADHFFSGRVSEVGDAIVDLLEDYQP